MAKIIGIDLWTTNSCVAYMLWDKSEVIANSEGLRTTPSIVYIKGDELLVWELAKRKAVLSPKNVIFEVKRWIWRKYSEVKDELKKMPYDTKEWSDWGVLIVVDWKEYKPEQISAFILQKLKKDAETYLWETINQAVITVPAYFNDSQRQATKVAWEIAWLKVERIVNEPTAAALAYGEQGKKDSNILVFDLWGGTEDNTVMEVGEEWLFQVLSTSWDTQLWGADWDNAIVETLLKHISDDVHLDLSKDSMALQRIKEAAENAKKELSTMQSVTISIPFLASSNWIPYNLEYTLTRSKFEEITNHLFERCRKPLLQAIKDSWLTADKIDEIILVGGSTRMTKVKDMVKEIVGKEPKAVVNPDEAVAQGAAIQAGIVKWDVKDILLLDVTPLSLWVEIEWGIVHVLIPRNTTIPAKKSNIYTTWMDNQTAVTVHVVQGERQFARDNKSLWMFNLEWIPPMRRGQPQIEVTFDIDANGILEVSAKETSTWKTQKVTIQGSTNLSDEEIAKAKADAEKFADEDKKKKEIVEQRNKVESMMYQTEQLSKDYWDKLDGEIKTKIETTLTNTKEKLKNDNLSLDELKALEKEIQDLQWPISESFQKNNVQPNQNSWTTQDSNSVNKDWDIIDAD